MSEAARWLSRSVSELLAQRVSYSLCESIERLSRVLVRRETSGSCVDILAAVRASKSLLKRVFKVRRSEDWAMCSAPAVLFVEQVFDYEKMKLRSKLTNDERY